VKEFMANQEQNNLSEEATEKRKLRLIVILGIIGFVASIVAFLFLNSPEIACLRDKNLPSCKNDDFGMGRGVLNLGFAVLVFGLIGLVGALLVTKSRTIGANLLFLAGILGFLPALGLGWLVSGPLFIWAGVMASKMKVRDIK
jgi:hypothetical protein